MVSTRIKHDPRTPVDLDLGPQTSLSLLSVVRMTVSSVRSRLGRSMITLFGVVLGTAFLMAVVTGGLLAEALSQQEAVRTEAADAAARVEAELATLEGRTLGVLVETPNALTQWFISRLADRDQVRLRIFAPEGGAAEDLGERVGSAQAACENAHALILCNDGVLEAAALPPNVADLTESFVMDLAGVYDPEALRQRGLHYVNLRQRDEALDVFVDRERGGLNRRARTAWLIGVSLMVSGIGIANALLMSVTERFREIGTLKCLGARDRLVVQMFIIESGVLGLIGSVVGVAAGLAVAITGSATTYGWPIVWSHMPVGGVMVFGLISLAVGLLVAMVAAIYPAMVAARMSSADAMRTDV